MQIRQASIAGRCFELSTSWIAGERRKLPSNESAITRAGTRIVEEHCFARAKICVQHMALPDQNTLLKYQIQMMENHILLLEIPKVLYVQRSLVPPALRSFTLLAVVATNSATLLIPLPSKRHQSNMRFRPKHPLCACRQEETNIPVIVPHIKASCAATQCQKQLEP